MGSDTKVSVYLGGPLLAALEDTPGQSRSGRTNWIAEAYRAIVARELRGIEWTRAEWCAVMDALNGAQIEVLSEASWSMAWANVADSPELGPKWGVDVPGLAARYRALSAAGRLAVYEAAARFWSRARLPTDAALAAAGVQPVDAPARCDEDGEEP